METSLYYNKIEFNQINRRIKIDKDKTIAWLTKVAQIEGSQIVSLSYNFCSDEYLLQINRAHLNHDYYTDIITFDLSDSNRQIEGDIYISLDRVRANAKELKTDPIQESYRVLVHGLLHLLGYKDKTKAQVIQMREKEERYLSMIT